VGFRPLKEIGIPPITRGGVLMMWNLSLFLSIFLFFSGCQSPVAWWKSINHKAAELRDIEARYSALSKEHETLRKKVLELERQVAEGEAKEAAMERGALNLKATGSSTGRTLATVKYQVPEGLPPGDLLDLAYEHLRERRYGEAAKTFHHYFALPETAGVVDAAANYSLGVANFQMGNLQEAKAQWAMAKSAATGEQKEKIGKKVDLWLRVLDRKIASVPEGAHGASSRGPALAPGSEEPELFPRSIEGSHGGKKLGH
jgi:hypothetical protein